MHPTRRDALRAAPLAALALTSGGSRRPLARAAEPPAAGGFPGMIVRKQEPANLEFPFPHLSEWRTPTEHFYVRNHFPVPAIDPAAFRLTVEGLVESKLELSLADLQAMGTTTVPATLECAGNGRVHLIPAASGAQWGEGAVGNAEWTGVPLAAVLERARVKAGATDVVFVGADKGAVNDEPKTPGVINFDHGISLAKARKPEVLLAHGMNGEPLTPAHGFPLRAVVGGWYGMASVKWLTRIVVTDKPHAGHWQTLDYSYFERRDGLPTLVPVAAMQPKASVARPSLAEVVPAGRPYRVHGAAWAGESKLAKVEVTFDGGATWRAATLTGDDKPFCWRTWEYAWDVPAARGPLKVAARATAADGTVQPDKRDPDRRSYMINHVVPFEVVVR